MPRVSTAQEEAARAKGEAMARARVADAYKQVFGTDPKKRTAAQTAVWEDLQKVCSFYSPVFTADSTGALCPIRGAHVDGRRWVWLTIDLNVKTEVKVPD